MQTIQSYEVLEKQVQDLIAQVKPQQQNNQSPTFQEPQFQESGLGLKTKGGMNLIVVMLGAAFAGAVGGMLNRFIPLGSLSTVVAGLLGRHFFKTGFANDFFTGVMIAGGAVFLSGITGSITGALTGTNGTGGLFSEPRQNEQNSLQSQLKGVSF